MKVSIQIWAVAVLAAVALVGCASAPAGGAVAATAAPAVANATETAEVAGKWVSVNDNEFTYSGHWSYAADKASLDKYLSDDHYSDTKGAFFEVKFTGVQVKLFGTIDKHHGDSLISIDGGAPVKVSFKDKIRKNSVKLFVSPVLAAGPHTLHVEVAGGGVITADRIDYSTGQ